MNLFLYLHRSSRQSSYTFVFYCITIFANVYEPPKTLLGLIGENLITHILQMVDANLIKFAVRSSLSGRLL